MSRISRRRATGEDDGAEARSPWVLRLATVVLVVVSALFSFLNAGERVSVSIGILTLYQISLVGLVFAVFILGMLTMFLFGLDHDRSVRRALRYRESPFPPPRRLPPAESVWEDPTESPTPPG